MPTAEARYAPSEIAKFYRYEPDTGHIYWRSRVAGMTFGANVVTEKTAKFANTRCANQRAEYRHNAGYLMLRLFTVAFLAQRVAWALHHGVWPDGLMDHENGVRTDNRIENLRVVDATGNSMNTARNRVNRSMRVGVHYDTRYRYWIAYINHQRQRVHLGSFATREDAVAARVAAELRFGYHPNHGRPPRASVPHKAGGA